MSLALVRFSIKILIDASRVVIWVRSNSKVSLYIARKAHQISPSSYPNCTRFNKMDESTNQAFPVPWNELKLYRHQDGINPHFGAKNEPLPPQDGLSLSPKYIQSWGKHSFELEVTHGFGASYFVELYEVSYTPGDHTSYRLLDLNTGQYVSYKCAPYAIRNEALHRERLNEYLKNKCLLINASTDQYFVKLFGEALDLNANPVSRWYDSLAP